jgi:acetoin utilization deacetylase AcuC-like enzyme
MRVVYSPRYHIDIGAHVFPTIKYQALQRALVALGGLTFVEPDPAPWELLALVHTPDYLEKIRTGDFTVEEIAQIELPWAPEIVEGFRLMTGGTLLAASHALEAHLEGRPLQHRADVEGRPRRGCGLGLHVGGGFHHAFANHGEGFCLFNDVAVSIRSLQREARIARAAIVDCDVHHGNGTAMIFDRDPSVFTFSIHQQHNYPAFKPRGSLDIGVEDRMQNVEYLTKLRQALPAVFAFAPDIVYYLAGADPFEDDQLGGLALTREGLRERDRLVLHACRAAHVPVVVTLAGGYARRLEDTVAIHRTTFEVAREVFAD